MNTSGALDVLVKEMSGRFCVFNFRIFNVGLMRYVMLSGTDADRQILAMECICNLSLGTEIDCEKLATSTASYLITFSNCQEEELVVRPIPG